MTPRKRYLWVTLTPAFMITLVATGWATWISPQVPDPMAVHFGPDLTADGYLSPTANILLTAGVCLSLIAGFTALSRAGMWHGASARILAAAMGFTITSLAGFQIQLFRIQHGTSDPGSATLSVGSFAPVFLVALLMSFLLAWAAVPVPEDSQQPGSVPDLALPERGTAVWMRSEAMRPVIQIFLAAAIVVAVLFAVVAPSWTTLFAAAVVVFGVLVTWGWHLRVDARGFNYRSFMGFPRGHVAADEVASAEVVEVNAGRWGGWGWRRGGSGTGLITRSGAGLRITRSNGRILEVTCRDAATAAALLQQYSRL